MRDVVAAEALKLRTLPLAGYAAAGTVLVGAVIAAALAAADGGLAAADAVLRTVPFVQGGLVLLGVLPASQEYAGRQLRTTLTAVPLPGRLLAGKTVAALVCLVLTAAATVVASLGAALLAELLVEPARPAAEAGGWSLVGAVGYLVIVGTLAHAAALLLRHLVPALTGVLALLLVLPPVLAAATEHARWLPDRAAAQLYQDTDPVLSAPAGAAVAVGWILLVGVAAVLRTTRSDP